MSSPKPVAGIAAMAVVASVAMATGPSLGEAGVGDGSQAMTRREPMRIDRTNGADPAGASVLQRVATWLYPSDSDSKRLVAVPRSQINAASQPPALPK